MGKSVDYLILGSGPAALFHAIYLRKRGNNPLLICSGLFGQLQPKKYDPINNQPVNILPIFPVLGSGLWNEIKSSFDSYSELSLHKVNVNHSTIKKKGAAGSYYEYLTQHQEQPDIPLTLSYKQFGDLIFSHPLQELRKKLNRNYTAGTPNFSKVGFTNGLSPYYLFLKSFSQYPIADQNVRYIDIVNKKVHTDKEVIQYDKLICTLPYQSVFELTHLKENFTSLAGDARFVTFYSSKTLPENHLWYDCKPHSPIYRIFTPHPNIITAQLARKSWETQNNDVGKVIEDLLGLNNQLSYLSTDTYTNCYPLDVSDTGKKDRLISYLAENDIYLSGRFGTWRYIDLHEVDYEAELSIRVMKGLKYESGN
ncbi:MAG: hypothetical protein JJU37_07005 [Balneolaceae bacterium]|nr:hypothetical protein [Balneolaceae bacterium]